MDNPESIKIPYTNILDTSTSITHTLPNDAASHPRSTTAFVAEHTYTIIGTPVRATSIK
jgi:hypothetical protein